MVIDATNRDRRTRSQWVSLAAKHGVPARAIWVDVEKPQAQHMNVYRGMMPSPDKRAVPDMVIHTFYKQLEEPRTSEGFAEVRRAQFVPGPFANRVQEKLFYMFLS